MKATGIVRRIDPLGRLVIPKEVRTTNNWNDGTPIEIFTTDDGVFLREFGRDKEVQEIIRKLDEADQVTTSASVKMAIKKAREFLVRS